jgi:hypothetical protein
MHSLLCPVIRSSAEVAKTSALSRDGVQAQIGKVASPPLHNIYQRSEDWMDWALLTEHIRPFQHARGLHVEGLRPSHLHRREKRRAQEPHVPSDGPSPSSAAPP